MNLDKLKIRLTVPEQNMLCIHRKESLEVTKENLIEKLILLEIEDFSEYGEFENDFKAEHKFTLKQCISLLESIDENTFKDYILKLEVEEDIEEE